MKKMCRVCLKLLLLGALLPLFAAAIPFAVLAYPIHMFNRTLCIRLATLFTYATWMLLSTVLNVSCTMEGTGGLGSGNYFVISNHLGSMDFMLINEIARKSGMIAHMKYAVNEGLKVFPVFYQILIYAGFLVLRRSFESDQKKIVAYFDFLKRTSIPMWFILYPEGSRFTERLRAISWEHSDKKNMPRLHNVLFPRYKGFKLICELLRSSRIEHVADVTFFYTGGETPPLWRFLFTGLEGAFRYDIRTTPISEIEDCEDFIYRSFERKEALIEKWRAEMIK